MAKRGLLPPNIINMAIDCILANNVGGGHTGSAIGT